MTATRHEGLSGIWQELWRNRKRGLVALPASLLLAVLLTSGAIGAGERKQQSPDTRSHIPVVLHVVACAPDLLHCRDLDTRHIAFSDMPDCRKQLAVIEAHTWGLADRHRLTHNARIVMGRCRYLLSERGRHRDRLALPEGRRIRTGTARSSPKQLRRRAYVGSVARSLDRSAPAKSAYGDLHASH